MRKLIEYTLISLDGVCAGPAIREFAKHRDEAYLRDGMSQLMACDAMLLGRTTYEQFEQIWPARADPWAERLNAMEKYVFSSTLQQAGWANTTILGGDPIRAVTELKQRSGRDLIIYGHGRLARTLLQAGLTDVLDVAVYPLLAGSGGLLFGAGETAAMKLIAAKTYASIVKITFEPESP